MRRATSLLIMVLATLSLSILVGTSPATAYGVPYDPSPVTSVRTTHSGNVIVTHATRANGGSTHAVTRRTRKGVYVREVTTITTVIVTGSTRRTYVGTADCRWDVRDRLNTNRCTFR